MDNEKMGKKRLAICFFGHLRTYKKTHQNFFKNIVEPNLKDGWEIDIFMHTWDIFQEKGNSRHTPHMEKLYPTILDRKVDEKEIGAIIDTYGLKEIQVENGTGMYNSIRQVSKIYQKYQKMHSKKYNFILYTRPDIMFFSPLRLEDFVGFYCNFHENISGMGLPEKITFCAMNYFNSLPFIDPRFMNEGDLLWVNNFDSQDVPPRKSNSFFVVPIKYNYYVDFIVWREINKLEQFDIPWNIPYVKPWILSSLNQIKNLKLNFAKELESKSQQLTQIKSQLDSKTKDLDSTTKSLKTTQDIINSHNFKNKP